MSWIIGIKILSNFNEMDLTLFNLHYFLAKLFIISNLYSIQFVISHELIHKAGTFSKALGTFHMIPLYYSHFTLHHLNTHHKWVGTPLDPTTAVKG